jgi:hypothetical protein
MQNRHHKSCDGKRDSNVGQPSNIFIYDAHCRFVRGNSRQDEKKQNLQGLTAKLERQRFR